jgi:hypothetical protein
LLSIHVERRWAARRPFGHAGCGTLTQLCLSWTLVVASCVPALAQSSDFAPLNAPPRLLLTARRQRLLERERERGSARWEQFDALASGRARFSEPALARALWARVSHRPEACREAAEAATDVRQAAFVYDWCQSELSDPLKARLVARLAAALDGRESGIQAVRARVLAALALYDVRPRQAESALRQAIEECWRGEMLPRLRSNENPFEQRADLYAMVELLHVVRDNLRLDLREGAERWFDELPALQILSYYPQPWPAPENEYHVPAYWGDGEPNLAEAALSRAAELALVAYDANAQPHQFLQGWLIQDRFQLKSELGCVYEFLWANPYQPGLSYSYMPDLFHGRGQLLVRSSWDEDATWFWYDGRRAQAFIKGRRASVTAGVAVELGAVRVFLWKPGLRFETGWLPDPEPDEKRVDELAYIVGLPAGQALEVEVEHAKPYEARADQGGILELRFKAGRRLGVRLLPAPLASRPR